MVESVTVEVIKPVKVRFRAEGLAYDLRPGQRAELPRGPAQRLLASVPDRVRLVEPIRPNLNQSATAPTVTVEPAGPPHPPIHWESASGVIHRGRVTDFGRMIEADGLARFWGSIIGDDGSQQWVHESRWRSRRQYEAQRVACAPTPRTSIPLPRARNHAGLTAGRDEPPRG